MSCTMTSKLVDVLTLSSSVALQPSVVVPSANVEPLAGVHEAVIGVPVASVAVTENVTEAPAAPVASAVIVVAPDIVGGVVSAKVATGRPNPIMTATRYKYAHTFFIQMN